MSCDVCVCTLGLLPQCILGAWVGDLHSLQILEWTTPNSLSEYAWFSLMNTLLSQEAKKVDLFDFDFSRKKYQKNIKTNKYKMQKQICLCNPGEDIKTCFHRFYPEYKCVFLAALQRFYTF